MGWSAGKGLGANEDGNVKNVGYQLKNDNRGKAINEYQEKNLHKLFVGPFIYYLWDVSMFFLLHYF